MIKNVFGLILMVVIVVSLAPTCFADFKVEISLKDDKVKLFEQKPVLIAYKGNVPVYSAGQVVVHAVLTNQTEKDQTLRLDACHTVQWVDNSLWMVRATMDCADYAGAGAVVLKSKEKFESDIIMGLEPGVKKGELKFKLGYDLGFVQGVNVVDWSNEVSVSIEQGSKEQQEAWEKLKG